MYNYYVLRGTQEEKLVELEGEIDAELLPGVDLDDGPTIINQLLLKLKEEGASGEWTTCDLTDSFFERENAFICFHGRWMRHSDAPWRKDRSN
jgi:hypothetical protein